MPSSIKLRNNNKEISNSNRDLLNQKNIIFNTGLTSTKDDRYCTHCHIKLVHKFNEDPTQKYVYSCPVCNVSINIYETEPSEKLRPDFPITDPTITRSFNNTKKLVQQADKDRLSRSEYFIVKNQRKKKNEIEANDDPYLADFIRRNNKLTITNVEYYDPNNDYDDEDVD